MSVIGSEFYETYKLYANFIGYDREHPYTYMQWMRLDSSYKCAALYCQFYPEITLAWYKVATTWNTEVEGVEEIHKYLLKNVAKIEEDENRFSPRYIYRVAWNCFDCLIPKWVPKLQWRINNEIDAERTNSDGEPYSVFDYLYDDTDSDFDKSNRNRKWAAFLESLDSATRCYLDFILGSITEYTFLCNMKRLGKVPQSIRDKANRSKIVADLSHVYRTKLRAFVFENLDSCEFKSYLDFIDDQDRHLLEATTDELVEETLCGNYGQSLSQIAENLDFRYEDVYRSLKKLAESHLAAAAS